MSERDRQRRSSWTVGKLVGVAALMFGFGFALVPLYQVICEITGMNGFVSNRVAENADVVEVDRSREITVEFVATVNNQGPWEFRPVTSSMKVHPGEIYTTAYYAENLTAEPLVGQASYSVAPGRAARWFGKPDCFCFTQQKFAANEGRDMPVTFFVSPNLPEDVKRVTLAYTFFELSN